MKNVFRRIMCFVLLALIIVDIFSPIVVNAQKSTLIKNNIENKNADFKFRKKMKSSTMRKATRAAADYEGKKFIIKTIFKTSNVAGSILKGQKFIIHLDEKLKVNDEKSLSPIKDKDKVIAEPKYDKFKNEIVYEILEQINNNIDIPLNIEVDYNTKRIDRYANEIKIENSITGIGVKTVKLPPVIVDSNGKVVNTILEAGGNDITSIIEYGSNYRLDMDVNAYPIYENSKLTAIDWVVEFIGDKDLSANDRKLITNFTTVKGSGLGEIQNIKLNGEAISLEQNDIKGKLGIIDSLNHKATTKNNKYTFTFKTQVKDYQSQYMLDISVLLKGKNKTGAVRFAVQGYEESQLKELTPNRTGMNNRTTVMGKFKSLSEIAWTITDAVSTEDKTELPLESRKLSDNQIIKNGAMAVYGLNDEGRMIELSKKTLSIIPEKKTDPNTIQKVGTIAVYEFNTNLTDSKDNNSNQEYTLAGLKISPKDDVEIYQEWSLADNYPNMPAQGFEVIVPGEELKVAHTVNKGEVGKTGRKITIPGVKTWNISNEGIPIKIIHEIKQKLPQDENLNGRMYTFIENVKYYKSDLRHHYILNIAKEKINKIAGNFSILKVDADDKKAIEGATFKLIGAGKERYGEVVTNSEGIAKYHGVMPGVYTLVETKAAIGYRLDALEKTITVSDDGSIKVEGENVKILSGGGEGATKEKVDKKYPSYMNVSYYGVINKENQGEFYIYLKPRANVNGGSTNRNTRLNLCVENGTIKDVEVFDVYPKDRQETLALMNQQKANIIKGKNIIGNVDWGVEPITGTNNVKDIFTKKTGYQIKFPKSRFNNDWGFLVKARIVGNYGQKPKASFDWLTEEKTEINSKLQDNIVLVRADEIKQNIVTLEITNEKFESEDMKIIKLDNNKKGLSGAEFTLRKRDGRVVSNKITDENGVANFGKINQGNYILEETKSPKGYLKSKLVFEVTVDKLGMVKYKAIHKDGGTPQHGIDYFIETVENTQDITLKPKVTVKRHEMILKENIKGSTGKKTKVWEAYEKESYRFEADLYLKNVNPGSMFSIDFDPNLNFKKYVYGLPKIHDATDPRIIIAEPYFNYETNRLTYLFNNNTEYNSDISTKIIIKGITPDIYYAKYNGTYNFTNIIDPGNPGPNKTLNFSITTDYGTYHKPQNSPAISYDLKDTFKKGNKEYVTAIGYYNPTTTAFGERGGRTLKFDWLSGRRDTKTNLISEFRAEGSPAISLREVRVYRVEPDYVNGKYTNEFNMPKSYGIRPSEDPKYKLVYKKTGINESGGEINDKPRNIRFIYLPENIKSQGYINGAVVPMQLSMPKISANNEGYVIENIYEVVNSERFYNTYRVFYMGLDFPRSGIGGYGLGNYNGALAEQTQKRLPKVYNQRLKIVNNPYISGQFKILKLSSLDRNYKLQGATFTLIDSNGRRINRRTDENGSLSFTELEPGKYSLLEIKAPENYIKSEKFWEVYINEKGDVSVIEGGMESSGARFEGNNENILELQVENKPVGGNFIVYKRDINNKPLFGAKFSIRKINEPNNTKEEILVSNDNGVVEFKNLETGEYILEEIQAPFGYKKLEKKWVIVVDENNKCKIYDYAAPEDSISQDGNKKQSLLNRPFTKWVLVSKRPHDDWSQDDNRYTGYTEHSINPYKLGARIIGKNKSLKHVVQRFVINPEGERIGQTKASIHREKPEYQNMSWYSENDRKATYKVYKLDKPVTGRVDHIRLENYKIEDITEEVKRTAKTVAKAGEPNRLELTLPASSGQRPYIIDVIVPYEDEQGGVGLGMDLIHEDNTIYWKSDYYEKAADIVEGDLVKESIDSKNILGAYISDDSLEIINEPMRYEFKFLKVKEGSKLEKYETISEASFKLIGPLPDTNAIYQKSNAEGLVSFKDLLPGTYKLMEDSPAQGYDKDDTTWTVIIRENGDTFIRENKSTNPNNTSSNKKLIVPKKSEDPTYRKIIDTSNDKSLIFEQIDPNDSKIFGSKNDEPKIIETKIMGIRRYIQAFSIMPKIPETYKQIFLINREKRNISNCNLIISSFPEKVNVIGVGLSSSFGLDTNLNVLRIKKIDPKSTLDNIIYIYR